MQTIPELNTNYSPSVQFDLGNSLLKGKQLQQADLENSLLRTRIESRPETMRIQREQADADLTKTNMEIAKTRFGMVRDALATVDVDNLGEEDYTKMRDWAIKTVKADPSYLPAIDRFYKPDISGTKKVLDKDKFKAWRQNAISTSDTIMKDIPKEGATHTFAVDTPDGVKDKTIQFRNGKWEELGMGSKFASKDPKQSRITLYNIKNPNKTRTVWVEEGVDYADPEGWTQKTPWKPDKPEKPEKLTLADVKSAYGMEVSNIKNRMLVEMTPEEQQNFANQPTENILASLLAGSGKSLSPEKKKQYIGELRKVESYYENLTNQVLGRKGVVAPTSKGRNIDSLVSFYGKAKNKQDALRRMQLAKDQGWTKEEAKKAEEQVKWAW
ncbi:MAG TPA: hypothetical protein ACFYD4_03300 [Candidatus Wunengus sp. YC61]|uniref:hypothetical protein n=1 Tax=Candidatus Wunengus sp. YC61 TaxID=3367698 RepID=UPI00402671E2